MKLRFFVLASALFASTLFGCSTVPESSTSSTPKYQVVIYGEGCKPTRVMIRKDLGISYNEATLKTEDVKTGEVAYFKGNIQVTEATPKEVAAYMKDAQIALIISLQERGVIPSCK